MKFKSDSKTEKKLNELHLFAGAGGGILGGMLLGHTTVCAVELEPYCREVLLQRQRDGILPRFPIWDDVTTFDGTPWRGRVDVVCGGFPCQDISSAGKGAGIDGERSGLWSEMARIIGEIQPRFAFVENSPMLTFRGLGRVLGDLSELGYDARWGIVGAYHVGAPHRRERIWILARRDKFLSYSQHNGTGWWKQQQKSVKEKTGDDVANTEELFCNGGDDNSRFSLERESLSKLGNNCSTEYVADPMCKRQQRQGSYWYASDPAEKREGEADRAWAERVGHIWGIESRLGRVANGVADRVDRLKSIGNGQVPIVAATAWRILGGE